MSDLASKIISLSPATTAGSGELNLVGSPSNGSGWLSANGGGTLSTTSTAGDLPLGTMVATAIKITSGTGASTEATLAETNSFAFTTPASYAVKTKVELWMRPGTLFLPNEWTVSVYAGSTRQSLTTDSSSVTYLPNANGKFTTYFDAVASTAYTVRFCRVNNAGVNAGVLNVTNVIVGPGIQPQGAVVGPWLSYTPTFAGFGTVASIVMKYRQVGDSVEIAGNFTAGTPTATNATFTLPNGYSSVAAGATNPHTGRWARNVPTGATRKSGQMLLDSSGSALVYFSSDDYTAAVNPKDGMLGTDFIGTGDILTVANCVVPIASLAGSGTVNLAQNDVEYYYGTGGTWGTSSTITTAQGQGGVLGGTTTPSLTTFFYTIVPTTPIPISVTPVLQVSGDGVHWSNVPSTQLAVINIEAFRNDGTNYIGACVSVTSTGNLRIDFGKYASAVTSAWSGTWYWRVVVAQPGQAVGFGAFQAASTANPAGISGLVPALGLPGRTDGVAVAAGYVGEVVTSGQLGGAITISNSIAALGSQLLHAGSWLIIATASFNGAAGNTYFGAYLGTTTASSTGTTQGETAGFAMVISASGVGGTITLSKTVNISADTTYYLNCVTSTGTAGSAGILGNIKAVLIA